MQSSSLAHTPAEYHEQLQRLIEDAVKRLLVDGVEHSASAFTLPIRELARREKISPTKLYRLADEGEIDTVAEGKRRRVFVESWRQYLLRLKATQEGGKTRLPSSNPKIRARETASPPIADLPRTPETTFPTSPKNRRPTRPQIIERPQESARSKQQYGTSRRRG
jgi:hypothetical protein